MSLQLKLSRSDSLMLGATLVLVSIALIEWIWPRPLASDQAVDVKIESSGLEAAFEKSASSPIDHRVIAERPLFTVDRKPYQVPVEPAAPRPQPVVRRAPEPEPDVTFGLSAVIRMPGTEIAIVTVNGQTQTHKLRPGEALEGWTLREVRQDSAVFARAGRETTVLLDPEEQEER